jgi:hypothetical protein
MWLPAGSAASPPAASTSIDASWFEFFALWEASCQAERGLLSAADQPKGINYALGASHSPAGAVAALTLTQGSAPALLLAAADARSN